MQGNSDITESNILAIRGRYRKNWKERLLTLSRKLQDDIAHLIQDLIVIHMAFLGAAYAKSKKAKQQ